MDIFVGIFFYAEDWKDWKWWTGNERCEVKIITKQQDQKNPKKNPLTILRDVKCFTHQFI